MKLLLHTCCAPCSVYCVDSLREENIEPTLYWYNPNIHPYVEYKSRRDCLKEYAEKINVQTIFEDDYGLDEFCRNTVDDLENRCVNYCYPVRLRKTFEYAKKNGFDTVSTTLFYSIYQKHDFIKKLCEDLAQEYGLMFLYRDFRIGFWEGHKKAKELELYMQKYCGCVFSEQSRNNDRINSDKTRLTFENKITQKNIRLGWKIPHLTVRDYKHVDRDFIYDVKKQVYQKYVEEIWGQWNEKVQRKLFDKFMKENTNNIEIMMLDGEKIGFYNGKNLEDGSFELQNICILPEHQNRGIGTAVLEEIIFENKGQEIVLQCFKQNRVIYLYQKLGFEVIGETENHYNVVLQ